ncbi:MAG: autotransporter outer membrane beta-barrel domain-containing protein [Rhodospirillaceae bacterium]|nr:autotransporter outer membrane beta-barrel domain-containing protein [Rhodospirillaceae bacterium]
MVLRPFYTPYRGPIRPSLLTCLAATTALCLPVVLSQGALAGPVTISRSTNAALRTSTGDGQGPGNITIDGDGSITVSTGVPLTVDSDNDVSVNGTLHNDQKTAATGLLVNTNDSAGTGRTITTNITLGGLINVPGPDSSDTNSANNVGLRFSGTGTMKGSFTATAAGSQISVGGRDAIGIAIDSIIDGSVNAGSAVTLNNGGGFGIRSTRAVTGNFTIGGNISAAGQDSIGVLLGGGIGGALTFTSGVSTGSQAFFDQNNRRVEAVTGGPAFWISSGVGQGVLLEGNQFTSAREQTENVPTDTATDSIIAAEGTNFGALRISQNSAAGNGAITIGLRQNGDGDSLTMRGRVQTSTSRNGVATTAMVITGTSATQRTVLVGGIRNAGGNIDAVSSDATATGLTIGDFASVPYLINTGDFQVRAADSTESTIGAPGSGGGNAIGISVAATSVFNSLINTGTFSVDARGKTFSASALIDNSGTLTYFENTGTYQAAIRAGSTGRAFAADLSRSQRNIDFRNSGTLRGDVTFGSGNDSFLSTGGTVTGNYSFGAGNDTVTIRKTTFIGDIDLGTGNHSVVIDTQSKFTGGIARGAGTNNVTISNSDIVITGGRRIDATTASITGTSTLDIAIDGQNAARPLIEATGRIVIDPTVKLTTRLVGLVTRSSTVTIISAGDLQLGIPIGQLATASTSYIYGFQYRIAPTNRNQLLLDVTRRTATQLGLGPNMGTTYESSLAALATDSELFTEIADTTTKVAFETAVQQLMPDASDAALYSALRTQNLAYGVIRNRLGSIPRTTGPSTGTDYSSFWVQQLGSYGKRDAEAEQPGYTMYTVGIATGADAQFTQSLKGGMSISQVWSLPDEKTTNDRPMRISSTQVDLYGRHQTGRSFTQAIFGGSYDTYRAERRVVIGGLTREPKGNWKGYHMGGAIDTGTQIRLSDLRLTPYLRGSYMRTRENAYTETAGGNGVNLAYDARTQDSMRAGAGLVAQQRFVIFQDVGIEAELRTDLARELSSDPAKITARFASGGTTFTQLGQSPDKNIFGVGISLGVRDIFTAFSIDYDAEKSGDFLGHTLAATFRFRF